MPRHVEEKVDPPASAFVDAHMDVGVVEDVRNALLHREHDGIVHAVVRRPDANPAVPAVAVTGWLLQHHLEAEHAPPVADVRLQLLPAFEH